MSDRDLRKEIYLQSPDPSFNGISPIDEDRKKFLDDSHQFSSVYHMLFFFISHGFVSRRVKPDENWSKSLVRKAGERNGNAITRCHGTGRDCCSVHLEYSCSGFSLDVVCELLKVISVRLLARGAECSQKWISVYVSDLYLHYPYYHSYFRDKQLAVFADRRIVCR